MAGGTGGTGASPNGGVGVAGQTQTYASTVAVGGGAGGQNRLQIIDGSNSYGQFGAGGAGGSVSAGIDYYIEYFTDGQLVNIVPHYVFSSSPAQSGNSGAIILYWGGGNSQQAYPYVIPLPPPIVPPAPPNPIPTSGESSTCFPAGSQVLMANLTWKNIELVQVGELMYSVNGPAECIKEDITTLGNRHMITFADESIFWSEEHAFWTRENDREWWWSYNADRWRREVETGLIGGLLDNSSMRTAETTQDYAHISGWRKQKSQIASGTYDPDYPLYLPMTNGAPIVVNGYLVGAGVNEHGFDYTKIKWDQVVKHYKDATQDK